MLASPAPAGARACVPAGPDWRHEVKWDGVRLLADVSAGGVVLRTRAGRDVTAGFPEFADLSDIANDALFDGEAIAWQNGAPSFASVVDRVHVTSTPRGQASAARSALHRPATFVLFDLLRLNGLDITSLPLRHRRAALESIWTPGNARSLADTYADGAALLNLTAQQGLEGVVSKRLDSAYRAGVRSPDWVKFPHRASGSYVIGGWRRQAGSDRLGSVLIGSPVSPQGETAGAGAALPLRFRGRVGSGLAGAAGTNIEHRLEHLEQVECPFIDVPNIDQRGTRWVAPRIVIDVASHGVSPGARLRQPAYQRLRTDLDPTELDTDLLQTPSQDPL